MLDAWKARARALKIETHALYLASRDPRVPWYAKAFAACVVAYAVSPIDLIPDPIPVLGYVDDLLLLPVGVLLARRMIPPAVLADCRARATTVQGTRGGRMAAAIIVGFWIAAATAIAIRATRWLEAN